MEKHAADHRLVKALVDWAEGGVVKRVADRIGVSASTINRHYKKPAATKLSLDTLNGLREAYPDFPGWADRNATVRSEVADFGDRPFDEKFGSNQLPQIPVVGTTMGIETFDPERQIELTEVDVDDVLDHVARPASLARDGEAYALTVIGESMSPRFRPGKRVIVSPRAAIQIGDDVIVQLRGTHGEAEFRDRITVVLIKELVRRTPSFIELRQYRPELTFQVDMKRVAKIHKVIGEVY